MARVTTTAAEDTKVVPTAAEDSEKDKKLAEAIADKQNLISILTRVKRTFDGFKKRHQDLLEA